MVNFPGNHLKFPRIAVILLTVIGMAAVSLVLLSTPEPKSDKLEDLAAFLASPSFRKLPEAKQEEYLKRMRPSRENRGEFRRVAAAMTDEQRRAMFENMRILHEKRREEWRSSGHISNCRKRKNRSFWIGRSPNRTAEWPSSPDGARNGKTMEAGTGRRGNAVPPENRERRCGRPGWKRLLRKSGTPDRGSSRTCGSAARKPAECRLAEVRRSEDV